MIPSVIAVTGSAGFVARHLIPALISSGSKVHGLDKVMPTGFDNNRYIHITGDIEDREQVASLLNGVDAIVHLAAEHRDFGISSEQYESVNVHGMRVLLSEATSKGIEQITFYSSVAVYGSVAGGSNEGCAPNPVSEYGKSKLRAEAILVDWANAASVRAVAILRPTVIYGEHNRANMYRLIDSIYKQRYLQIGNGVNRKSTLYIGNAIDATLLMMNSSCPGVRIYNMADDPPMSSKAIADSIARLLGKKNRSLRLPVGLVRALALPLDFIARVTNIDIPITSARISKYLSDSIHSGKRLREAGFKPRFSHEDGFRRTVQWYLNESEK